MGGSAGSLVKKAVKTVTDTVSEASPKANKYLGSLAEDPTRSLAAIGTAGGFEPIREVANEASLAVERDVKSKMPGMDAPPVTPLPGSGGDKPAEEPVSEIAKQTEEYRAPRGRASTILTGSRGLRNAARTARRTLLGV